MLEGFLILSGYINKDAHGKPLITDVEIAPTEVSSPDGYKYRNKTVAGIYGIFLGSLGIHRFYLGYTTIGIIQIIVTIATSGVGGMWGFVEGILILSDSINEDAEGRPLICFNEEQ
ncbi:MAG: TM2 domain-containing protein [Nitrospirae bacterium]|nr:TM2 domain-containing protein [Nitrospirota bacterium]